MSKLFVATEKMPFAQLQHHVIWSNMQALVKYKRHQGTTEKHYHPDFYELVFVRNGSGVNRFDDAALSLSAGDFFLIPPKVWHHYERAAELEIYNIIFSGHILEYFKYDIGNLTNYHLMFGHPGYMRHMDSAIRLKDEAFPEVVQLLEEIVSEQQTRREGAKTVILSDFLRVIILLCRHGESVGDGAGFSNAYRISLVLTKLNAGFEKPWSLEKMARLAGMSVSSFRQQFFRAAGTTPGAYLLDLRLRKALAFLMLHHHSIGEVSAKCGFRDSNYFSRQFRKKYGLSPRRLRAEAAVPGALPQERS